MNRSDVDFSVADGKICFGLSAIKGCGGAAAGAIVAGAQAARAVPEPLRFLRTARSGHGQSHGHRIAHQGRRVRFARRPRRRNCSPPSIGRCNPGASAASDRRSGQTRPVRRRSKSRPKTAAATAARSARVGRSGKAGQGKRSARLLSVEPSAGRARKDAGDLLLAHDRRGGRVEASHRSDARRHDCRRSSSRTRRTRSRAARAATRCSTWKTPRASCAASAGRSSSPNYEELIKADAIVVIRGAIDKRPGSEEANLIVNEMIPLEDLAARYTRA